jgi:DNA/RNA endonuclease G (NUC1)
VPQAANLNRGAWKTMENEWAAWVNSGYRVDYTIDVYPPGAVRPDSFEVEYTVSNPHTGQVVHRNWPSFWNEAGETFDRVPRGDMPTL